MRPAIESSVAVKLSRLASMAPMPRMRRPSPLPTVNIVPTRSSYLQRFLWLLGAQG